MRLQSAACFSQQVAHRPRLIAPRLHGSNLAPCLALHLRQHVVEVNIVQGSVADRILDLRGGNVLIVEQHTRPLKQTPQIGAEISECQFDLFSSRPRPDSGVVDEQRKRRSQGLHEAAQEISRRITG